MAEEAKGNGGKKIHRSPNHPFFSLADAIAKIKLVYDVEKRTPTTGSVIVKHLGYSETTGPGGRTLSALRQYGLLDETAGKYRVSDIAFSILHYPDSSKERREAIKKAAVSPTLYRELLDLYPAGAGSDDTLKEELLRRGFNPAVTDRAVGDFRTTITLAGLADVSYTDLAGDTKMPNQNLETPLKSPGVSIPGAQTYSFALSPDVRAELTLKGAVTPDDLDLLRDHIELTIKALARKSKALEQ
jgi:hypothetical protein